MIKRLVKLTFRVEEGETFKALFEATKEQIRAVPGCQHVELLQVKDQPHVFFTFSLWENEDALEAYRHSDFFKATWKKTKALFDDRPKAWSTERIS